MNQDLWTLLEWGSAVLAGAYTFLAAFEKRIGWIFAIVSSLLMMAIYVHRNYTGQVLLNGYYVAMGFYGWVAWGRDDASILITRKPWMFHLVAVASCLVLSALVGWVFKRYALSESPYMDAWVTVFSVLATWMMARKLLENWIYWCLVDGVAITLYVTAEPPLVPYALLFSTYVVLSAVGWWKWSRSFKLSHAAV